ncbi:MarR family transcriptional regulator [Agromyces tropicus]|uniref:MarR family transcriptional regulator n=1 Tax=Agromyces tropicus TaxID=555371 RepID=A0ABN2U335_9MICO
MSGGHETAERSDSLGIADLAVERTKERFPETDADAMSIVLWLHRVANVITYDLESSVHRPRGLSWPAFRLMFTIWVSGTMESKAAASQSGMSRAAVSSLTNTLDNLGLVTRTADPSDKRKILLDLTDAGRVTLEAALRENNVQESKWTAGLAPDEATELVRLLRKLGDVATDEWVNLRD